MATNPTTPEKGWHELKGELCQFDLNKSVEGENPSLPARRYTTVNLPYGVARKIFEVVPYDPVKGTGEQRPRIDSHIRKLMKAMLGGDFTPTPWAVGIRQSHLKNLEIDDRKKRVTLRVNERHPLPILDGGHRFESLNDIRKGADKEFQEIIDNLTITVLLHLEPGNEKDDFIHLQEGKPVNKSQLQMMRQSQGHIDEKKRPFVELAQKVAFALNASDESFLKDEIRFTSGHNGRVEYASITTLGGSDIGTSLAGGARIVLYPGFGSLFPGKDGSADRAKAQLQFLVSCYIKAYQGIIQYDNQEEVENPATGEVMKFPAMLMPSRMLRPTRMGGSKGGTGLLIMLGNMLAFRMLMVRKRLDIEPKDVKRLVEAAQEVLDINIAGGGSGTAKRELTGEFVRAYFKDVVRNGDADEHDTKKLGAIDGVPSLLCDTILTRSTLNVDRDAVEFIPADDVEEPTKGKRGRKKVHRPEPIDTDPAWTENETPEIQPDFEETGDEEEFNPPPAGHVKTGKNKETLKQVMG